MRRQTNTSKGTLERMVEWLNRPGPALDADGSVSERDRAALVESINRDRIEPTIEWLNELSNEPAIRGTVTVGWMLKRDIMNALLESCLVFPRFEKPTESGGWVVEWLPSKDSHEDYRRWISLVQAVAWLVERGLLSRLRRCARSDCKRWFLRKKSDNKFCLTTCGYAARAGEPERKEKKRNYMREFQRRERIKQKFPHNRRDLPATGYKYSGRKSLCCDCSAELEWWTRARGKIRKIPVQQIGERVRIHWSPHDIKPTLKGRRTNYADDISSTQEILWAPKRRSKLPALPLSDLG